MTSAKAGRIIGQPVLRSEDDRLLRGLGCYIDDVPEPAGTLHLAFVMSPHPHARILSVDVSAARAVAGVTEVLTGADFAKTVKPMQPDGDEPGCQAVARPVMATDRVRFVGEFVAVVVARDRYVAEDAAELVEVEYETLPALIDVEAARASDAIKLHDETRDNVLFRGNFKSEGFDAVLAGADLVVRDSFSSHRLATISIEPRGCLAVFDRSRDALTLWSSTQIPHLVRTALAQLLDWEETRLRVIAPDVGGGFGVKATIYPEEVIAAALARRFAGAVKWIGDRREDLLTSTQSRDYRYELAAAFKQDGTLLAIDAKIAVNIGAYPAFPFGCRAEATGAAVYMPPAYRLSHYAYETCSVVTNTCPVGVNRGVAMPASFFATEALMDRAAHKLGMDPADIRLKNVLRPDEFPYLNALRIKYDGGSYEGCLRRALEAAGYGEFRKRQPANRLSDGKYRGIGIGCIVEHTGQGSSRFRRRGIHRIPGFDSALVRLEPNGRAIAWVSQATQGQGHLTAFAQIVAEELGLEVSDVTVIEGDTAQGPYGTGTFASRGAVAGGGAVLRASNQVGEKLRRIAAHLLEAAPLDIELVGAHARVKGVPEMRVAIRDLAAIAYSLDARELPRGETHGLEATDYYDPPLVSITNATHIAQVAIDPVTGQVEVERYVVAHDCGRIINPMIVEGQIHGGVVQGLGSVLSEGVRYDGEGQQTTATLSDYILPTAADAPDIDVLHEDTWSTDTAGGFKGVGEGGVIGAVPAIANAIADALLAFNVPLTHLPIRPDRIIEAIAGSTPRA